LQLSFNRPNFANYLTPNFLPMHNFKELNVWKQSMDIAEDVNRLVELMPKHHLWGLGSQLLKTSVSVPSNIAEGCGRKTNEQFLYFLNVALASSFELETQILLAIRFESVDNAKADEVLKKLKQFKK
jgi:four helix bundle protein